MKLEHDWDAALYLENGHLFQGVGFGAAVSSGGEAVFNTGMTGYQEIFTDPSYFRQVVVMSYPHIGNTGINAEDMESNSLFLSGVVAREYCPKPSNWRSGQSLGTFLKDKKIPGIAEVDTRAITTVLREEGAQRAVIFPSGEKGNLSLEAYGKQLLEKVESMDGLELVSKVSCREPYVFTEGMPGGAPVGSLVVYDYGVKTNILRCFTRQNFKVHVVPYNFPHQDVKALKPDAVVLSNGPGDPEQVAGAVDEIQGLMGNTPIMAVCMGHQLLARALGATTYKLKFGHHGVNHPVKDLLSNRILITSQNHGFSVKASDLKMKDVMLSHVSLNDQTVEGFYSDKMKFYSVQFHPEAKPGPNDAASIFEHFVKGFLQ